MKQISIILLCFLIGTAGFGQDYKESIYSSYISGKMDTWKQSMDEMEEIWTVTGSIDILYDLVIAQYGYIGFSISADDKQEARIYLRKAEPYTDILLQKNSAWPSVLALQGALAGLKIGVDPLRILTHGRRAFSKNKEALEIGQEDPQVWMEKGNIELYKPVIYGRSVPLAIEAYQRAARLYEADLQNNAHNWLYLNTLISLAIAYQEGEMIKEANATFLKVLAIEPDLVWVRDEMYPEFLKKYGL